MHSIAILTFVSLAVSLLAMPMATPFAIIYTVQCVFFTFMGFCNEKVFLRLFYLIFYSLSTIAELSVAIWLFLKEKD